MLLVIVIEHNLSSWAFIYVYWKISTSEGFGQQHFSAKKQASGSRIFINLIPFEAMLRNKWTYPYHPCLSKWNILNDLLWLRHIYCLMFYFSHPPTIFVFICKYCVVLTFLRSGVQRRWDCRSSFHFNYVAMILFCTTFFIYFVVLCQTHVILRQEILINCSYIIGTFCDRDFVPFCCEVLL